MFVASERGMRAEKMSVVLVVAVLMVRLGLNWHH